MGIDSCNSVLKIAMGRVAFFQFFFLSPALASQTTTMGDGFKFECDTTCDTPSVNPVSVPWTTPSGGFWTDCSADCKLIKVTTSAAPVSSAAFAGGFGPSLLENQVQSDDHFAQSFSSFMQQQGGVDGLKFADVAEISSFLQLTN